MKFGKTYETAYRDTGLALPAFPYRGLKKQLKNLLESDGANAHVRFFQHLTAVARGLDAKWRRAASRLLLAARGDARLPALVARLLRGDQRPVQSHAAALAAWAGLTREALRKIVKKFNKRYAECCGVTSVATFPACGIGFIAGDVRTQIEALSLAREDAEDTVGCPVCLEVLFRPVVLRDCGHAMCRQCFGELQRASTASRRDALGRMVPAVACPMCRSPACSAAAAPALGLVAKEARNNSFKRRQEAAREESERKIEMKHSNRVRNHPMALMLA